MRAFEAPAKVNLSLHVAPPRNDGFHPLESLVQTIQWCDLLEVTHSEEWSLEIDGADIDEENNLVTHAFRLMDVQRVSARLVKNLPIASGLGGGSSDGAAALVASTKFGGNASRLNSAAADLGADVPMFLEGGTQLMTGRGELLERRQELAGFALAVVVPDIHISTPEVYARWDEMEGPEGEAAPIADLPPSLRDAMPLRNDLLPAARAVAPELGEAMAEMRRIWGQSVLLTGSGPSCFGFFPTLEEAADAAVAIPGARAARGVALRSEGVSEKIDR